MKRLLLVVILALVLLLTVATPVLAIALPDSTPARPVLNVYRNLLETGDRLILIYSNIPYATPPTTPASQAFIWRLFNMTGVEIASIVPYAFNDNGYGYNLSSIYLDAGNVTASGIVWGNALPIKLSGNPSAFTTPPEYNYTLASGDYSALTTTVDEQAELASRILVIANDLNTKWGLTAAYSLLSETETGTVISMYGEAFFRGAIYGLQGLCPNVFAYVVSSIDQTPRTWTNTYEVALAKQYTGTWVQIAKNSLDILFTSTYSLTWLMIVVIACFVILLITASVSGDPWLGAMDFCFAAVIFTRLGFAPLGGLALLCSVALIYSASRIWGVFR